jgi:hypothetical protein
MSTGQRLGRFWPVHRQFCSYLIESSEITDQTNSESIPTKTQTVLPNLHVVPITYYYRMESTLDNVNRARIVLVLAST